MSDTEAGDLELLENPDPEDDADLSTVGSGDGRTEPAGSEPMESSSESLAQCTGEAPLSEKELNGCEMQAAGTVSAQRSENASSGTGENLAAREEEATENEAADQPAASAGSPSEMEWPPECERERAGNRATVQPGTAGEHDTNSSLAVCRQTLSGTESSDCLQLEKVCAEDEIQNICTENSEGQNSCPGRHSDELSDPEESPPEDEHFKVETEPVYTDSFETANPAPESEAASDGAVSASITSTLPTVPGADTACTEEEDKDTLVTARNETKDRASVSTTEHSSDQTENSGASAAVAKEDDQVPECDRKQTLPSCSESAHTLITLVQKPSTVCGGALDKTDANPTASEESDSRKTDFALTNEVASVSVTVCDPPQSVACESKEESLCDRNSVCDPHGLSAAVTVVSSAQQNEVQSIEGESGTSFSASAHSGHLKKSTFLDMDSEDEDLLSELDAELHLPSSPRQQQQQQHGRHPAAATSQLLVNGLKQVDGPNSELCKQFEEQLLELQALVLQKDREIQRLQDEKTRQREVFQSVMAERDKYRTELTALKDKNPDDLYLPQIKELEYTITQQQMEIRQLKEKLTTHDGAARRAIATLQNEMKARMDQITKLYEETAREKDSMVVRFAEAETKNIEAKRAVEKQDAKMRDILKEKEFLNNKMRAATADRQKAVADLEARTLEMGNAQKEAEKLKEELSSADYRIKWFQNKLKAELEAHKETKQNLEKTTTKLKEAKEETEVIRRDCQAIIKTYQESEEVRSNSLDKELKIKETELLIQRKEKSDTEEVHLQTKKELDLLKVKHKDAYEELKTLRDKVHCLEEERLQTEQLQSKYQTIIQTQKGDNTNLQKQLADFQTLKEDFDRAQDMIKTLDHEISDLKITNRDLTKDIEGCQERESKMLALQSELSRTNALLRSENTNLNNQVVTLSGEVQKMTMDIQDLETRCRNATEQFEEEQKKRREETSSLSTQLASKTKDCDQYKQKWEDEIDANKTLKRKHAYNVKDLTRQLQHAKKRLESYEASSGDRDATSMGSRTNSNGSLNSMDASNQHNAHQHSLSQHSQQPGTAPPRRQSQEPEYPVITEQVEVDKQVLIERIVRLQRSLARKNEKLEFLEEHIQQLVAEIKKKNKIIQGYIMREEAGTLVSDDMDANKALLARKGGIMASVYSMHQQDGAMTLDLSLEINRKLQAVLEDTLLKNMTLKENLDTLGAEIARLSQENRRLQLHLQQIQTH